MEMQKRRMRWWCFLIPVIAVIIRLAPLLRSNLSFAFRPDDSFEYLQLTAGMWHGCGFARLIGGVCRPAEILRTPGYPIFLFLLPDLKWALAAQAVVGGIVCLLVGKWIAGRWNLAAAVMAECFVAFDLTAVVMSSEVMSETLFQLMLVLALVPPLLAMKRPGRAPLAALGAGVAGGLAILVRPIGILLPILLPIPFLAMPRLSRGQRLVSAAAAFLIPTMVVAGWSVRNYEVADYPGLSTVSAIDLYYYRAADIAARRQGTLLAAQREAFGNKLGVPFADIFRADVQSPHLTRRMEDLSIPMLLEHPLQAVAMTIQAAIYLALAPIRTPLAEMLGTRGATPGAGLNAGAPTVGRIRGVIATILTSPLLTGLVIFEALLTLALWAGLVLAIVRCWRASADYRLWTLYLGAAAIVLLVLAAGGEADARFRAPVIPLLAIAAGLGYCPPRLLRRRQAAPAKRRMAVAAAAS